MRIKEVVVTGQNQVVLQDAELHDEEVAPGDLIIDTEYTFISAGTELANYTGKEPKVFARGAWCAYPWRSGYSNVGIVRKIGAGVTRANVGDRVFSYGNHASTVRVNQNRLVIPLPDGLDPVVAAAARMAGVSMTAIVLADIKGEPWVAVFGLGMVGNLAAQGFVIRGCHVIGVDPVESRRKLAASLGVQHTVGGSADEVQEAISKITGGRLANITVDAVGHSAVVLQAVGATASHGQIILLGTPRVALEGNLTKLLSEVHLRFLVIRGALEWCLPMYPGTGEQVSQFSKQEMIFDWIAQGKLKLAPLISHRLKPGQIQQAYQGLLNETETYTGVALDWT